MDDIVIDTNVIISALYSKNGASYKLLMLLDQGIYRPNISVPLFLEYESVANRSHLQLNKEDISDILNYLALNARKRQIFFLWRPYLKDAKDDLVLEVAVESESQYILTYNISDFAGINKFGIQAITPKEYLEKRGLLS